MTDQSSEVDPENENLDALIDEQLRFLEGDGPEPDLSALTPSQLHEALGVFAIVESMMHSGQAIPPIASDPVAQRLGLVPLSSGAASGSVDGITASVHETAFRFQGDVSVDEEQNDPVGDASIPLRFICHSLVERVAVFAISEENYSLTLSHARDQFAQSDEFTAFAYSTEDGSTAVVLTHGDCYSRLRPATGWIAEDAGLAWDPLSIALGRYFDRSVPAWDNVQRLDPSLALEGIGADIESIVSTERERVSSSRPKLAHNRIAREFVLACEDEVFATWAQQVRNGELSGEQVAEDIHRLVLVGVT